MGYLPAFLHPDRADSPGARHYRELLEQSAEARNRGEHWEAQRLASAAHRWAMEEIIRLQRLEQAQQDLARATKQLNASWNKDRDCATVEELRERHPEFKHVINNWDAAQERVRMLESPVPNEEATSHSSGKR